MIFQPRPSQEKILRYRRGKMGIMAVPGSGKTYTLSMLAATLISEGFLQEDQEILIVTLVNSAVKNFSLRIENFIQHSGLIPGLNYRVRTLHGLANDIIRENRSLVGLGDDFSIADERESRQILEAICMAWIRANPSGLMEFAKEDEDPFKDQNSLRNWKDLLIDTAGAFIAQAKDLQLSPGDLQEIMNHTGSPSALLSMGQDIYSSYQQAISYRGAIDFNDLIRLALQALESDPQLLDRLRNRWPYILEDEAQDSSRLQENILRLLSGDHGNWVRVGDSNQAIFETFTTASPKFLNNFCNEHDVYSEDLPVSGRSTKSILFLANKLINWTNLDHPNEKLRNALTLPEIEPTNEDDPQPNPEDSPTGIILYNDQLSPDRELQLITKSLARWLPTHPEETVAVLVPRNERGAKLVELLKQAEIEYIELLQSSQPTRKNAEIICQVLKILDDPTSHTKLAQTYKLFKENLALGSPDPEIVNATGKIIQKYTLVEELLLNSQDNFEDISPEIMSELIWWKVLVNRWHQSALLPIDQVILTISQDIFTRPVDLALSHKLALYLENQSRKQPEWRLPEFIQELDLIARNRRKFYGFYEEDVGFDPEKHKGKVVVSTIHKAKGLEWDRVYLTSVNNYDFPSAMEYDQFIGEKWFVRDQLNLQAEAVAHLKLLTNQGSVGQLMEGSATRLARQEIASERLRLLFVGITRAKKELIMTWNTGRKQARKALPFEALQASWEEYLNDLS